MDICSVIGGAGGGIFPAMSAGQGDGTGGLFAALDTSDDTDQGPLSNIMAGPGYDANGNASTGQVRGMLMDMLI